MTEIPQTEIEDNYAPIYELVRRVPSGRVVTYGQVADLVEAVRFTARQVGTAMRYAPPDVPWQRVVGAGGQFRIGNRSPELHQLQRNLLRAEGVFFREDDVRIDMSRSQWRPDLLDEEERVE